MEVAGAVIGVIGLAGLYNTCIETLDALSAAARFGVERELLQTKIEVERVRLMIWGESVGLTEIDLDPSKSEATEDDLAVVDEALQRTALRMAVAGLLACFVRTFEDVEELQKRYGLVPQAESTTAVIERPTREVLSATFRKTYASFQDRTAASQKQSSPLTRARWAVVDEPKFRALIGELKAINDSLTSLPAGRNKTRVKIRAEIMQSNDVDQLQNLVSAADDMTDIISETASLRLEMLSTRGQGIPRRPEPRVFHVSNPPAVSLSTPEVPQPRTPSPLPIVSPAVAPVPPPIREPSPAPAPGPFEPPFVPYDDTGALVVHKVYSKPESLTCFAWLSGTGEVPELSEVQPAFHPAFALRYLPDSVVSVAGDLLEVDVEADPKYAGWSPGSTSLTGFAREVTFWKQLAKDVKPNNRGWRRATNPPPLKAEYVIDRWRSIVQGGLGKNWTEKKGHDQVRELVGPSDYTWLDPQEGFKIRHQIADLLADMNTSPVLSLEGTGSIGVLANYEKVRPDGKFSFVDFLLQLVEAREVSFRIARSQRTWHGGITARIVYDMIAAELWSEKMILGSDSMFEASRATRKEQMDGLLRFADAMKWPHADEMRTSAALLLGSESANVQMDLRTWDWINGLVLPGSMFPLATVGTLYALSATLRTHLPATVIRMREGSYGVVYPQASYWSERSVVGKVLAPMSETEADGTASGIKCLGGWVGPCPSPSLPESTFGLVVTLQARPPTLVAEDNVGLADNLEARNMPAQFATEHKRTNLNAADWTEPVPPSPSTDTVTLQTLRLSKVAIAEEADRGSEPVGDDRPPRYRARLDFRLARSKSMVTMTLHANCIFVAAPPCRGTHRIDPRSTAGYEFRVLGIEDLPHSETTDTVLTVINATGGENKTAETFARAWCSQKGMNAVVWKRDGGRSCFKCALMVAGKDGLGTRVVIMV